MKIELCEDNGFLNNGKPSLVVLVVTTADGKQKRFPYAAKNTIQQLYVDIRQAMSLPSNPAMPEEIEERAEISTIDKKMDNTTSNVIAREDTVKCVNVVERDVGLESDMIPKVGKEYRILNIIKRDGKVSLYEVLDDAADNKIRIPVFPSEVELAKKFVPPPPRKMTYSVTRKCSCGEVNAIDLNNDGEKYSGVCMSCGLVIEEKRSLQKAA